MDSTVIAPTPGSAVVSGGKDHHDFGGHLWDNASLRESNANFRHATDHAFDLKTRIFENEARTADRLASIERQVTHNQHEMRSLMQEKFAQVTDLIKEQELRTLRDKLASVPRGTPITIPVCI